MVLSLGILHADWVMVLKTDPTLISIDIITVTHNSSSQLQSCWRKFAHSRQENWNWYVVDNASTDNSVNVAKNLGATVIELPQNKGFSHANNIGFNNSNSDLVIFANPDLEIDYDTLDEFAVACFNFKGLLAPQLLNLDGSYQANGRGEPYLSSKLAHRKLLLNRIAKKGYLPDTYCPGLYEVYWLMGAAVAVERSIFREIGLWDDGFFIYYEDHELGIRAKELGYRVAVDSHFKWKHLWARETTTFALKPYIHEFRSALRFYRKYPKYLR